MADRETSREVAAQEYRFGPFRFMPARRTLLAEGVPQRVGGRALDILAVLVAHRGEPVGKRELIARVWPNSVVEEGNLKVHVAALRRALGEGRGGARYIATVNGRGYCFVAPLDAAVPESPAPAPAPSGRPGLPCPPGRTIGREAAVATLAELLEHKRLVSIVGPGGIGKTTVALAVAEEVAARHGMDVCFVDLGSLADQKFVAGALAAALGLSLPSGDVAAALLACLRGRRLLLVLDSCEHVIDTAAVLAARLVAGAAGVLVLATSREPLRAGGEHVHRLAPLRVPPPDPALGAAEALTYSAVELFVERAADVVEGFVLRDADAAAVAEVCRRLEGIALAIELAATRIDAFTPHELAARLDDRFQLLERGQRSAQARHRTLSHALDWSYAYLPAAQQKLLRRVAVFAGPFTIDAASALCAAPGAPDADVVGGLAELVAKSLLAGEPGAALSYYRMLDTTKAYALGKLEECGETARVRRRHAEVVCALFQRAAVEWEGRSTTEWLAHYGKGIDDVRAALAWSMGPQGDRAIGIMLTVAAIPLWTHMSLLEECRLCVEQALDTGATLGFPAPQDEMKLQAARAAAILYGCGPLAGTGIAWSRTLALAQALGDGEYQLRALWGLSVYRCYIGDYRQALALAERFRAIAGAGGDRAARISVERLIATALHYLGDQRGARSRLEHMLERYVPPVQRSHIARFQLDQRAAALGTLANVLWLQGHPERALGTARDALQAARDARHPLSVLNALAHAACPIQFYVGDLDGAARLLDELHEHLARHGLEMWSALWRCLHAILQVELGEARGADLLQDALDDLRHAGLRLRFPAYLGVLAAAHGAQGRMDEARAAIDEALACCAQGGERWCVPELLRIDGELLERDDAGAAEQRYRRALALARADGTPAWALRAATSLVRLCRRAGRGQTETRMLARLLAGFSEGRATRDLLLARSAVAADGALNPS